MAGNPSIKKRDKERQRQERNVEKAQKRKERNDERAKKGPAVEGEDPDLAGIVPGPQPVVEDPA